MALPTPPPYSDPIPNNPFYSLQQYAVQGIPGLYIVGSGLSVSTSGVLTSTGGGGGGAVTGVFAGTGISVSGNTGNVTVSNTGVLSITAGSGIAVSGSTGNITISATSTATGTVTRVNTGAGLVGGPITTTGSIGLTMTGVSPGTYNNPTITVDSYGRISFASPGTPFTLLTATSPVQITTTVPQNISVQAASTAASGVVQLSDSTTSTASNTAATSLAVKTAFDAAVAAIPKSCITAKGALITGALAGTPVALPVGANGLVLTADSACAEGLKWASAGGASVPAATSTVPGIIAGYVDTTDTDFNTALGYCSLLNPAGGGVGNVAIGACAGCAITTGYANTVLGGGTAFSLTTGNNNLFVGFGSGCSLTSGTTNILLGTYAGCNYTTESGNIIIGEQISGTAADAGIIHIGSTAAAACIDLDAGGALSVSASGFGTSGQVLSSAGAGAPPTWSNATSLMADATPLVAGKIVGCTLPDGLGNGYTSLGNEALSCSTAASSNPATAIGYQAMKLSESALSVAVGQCALYGPAGFGGGPSVAIGANALKVGGGGDGNVAVGADAGLAVSTGACNVIIGCAAASALTSGGNNVLIGTQVAAGKTIGFGGTFVGYRAGCSAGSTQDSTFVGQYAGCGATGGRNTLFGSRAGCALTTGSDNVILGYAANVANPAGNTQLAIGMGASNWLAGDSNFAIKPGAGIIDCASSCGTANMVLTSQGNAIEWKAVNSAIAVPNYGSFLGVTTQTATGGANTGIPVLLDTTVAANNFLISNNSEVTAATGGIYNLQFSIQIVSTGGGGGDVEIWLAKNGTYVANSNTRFHIQNANEAEFAALNFVESLAAGDYLQLYWATTNTSIQLQNSTSVVTVPTAGPDIPAVILTIVPVGA